MKGHLISEITYEQCKEIINKDSIVVLPIGGGSKEHGSHLPMGTDYFVTDWLAKEVTKKANVITLPTLPYAYFPAFINWEGSVSINYDNFINFVKDIIMSFVKFGVKKFMILDGGVSTNPPLKLLALTLNNEENVKVAVTNCLGLGKEVDDELCKQKMGGHADEAETSTMLYINENLVHMEKTTEEYVEDFEGATKNGILKVYVPFRMDTPTGSNGNSKLATKEKGEKMLYAKIDDIICFLEYFAKLKEEDF